MSLIQQQQSCTMPRPSMDVRGGSNGLRAVGESNIAFDFTPISSMDGGCQSTIYDCVFDWATSTVANADCFEKSPLPDVVEEEPSGEGSERTDAAAAVPAGTFRTTLPFKYGTTTLMLAIQGQNCGYRTTNHNS